MLIAGPVCLRVGVTVFLPTVCLQTLYLEGFEPEKIFLTPKCLMNIHVCQMYVLPMCHKYIVHNSNINTHMYYFMSKQRSCTLLDSMTVHKQLI